MSQQELQITREDDVSVVRRAVRQVALARAFDAFASAAITTATSELTRNVWVHAGGGRAIISELMDGPRSGIRIEFIDKGPGIPNLERVLRGGFSTAGSLGLGLSGSQKLVDEFTIETATGSGTRVVITKWKPY
ncbi:MAG TPA: ATP-binding protein [Polyangiaceae bacterium]|nr:ATP-binding protein [Polyangiaceae bacterium]